MLFTCEIIIQKLLLGLSEEGNESESEEEYEEEKEDVGFQLKTSGHVDSGSDTDEFCDTSDQLIQV